MPRPPLLAAAVFITIATATPAFAQPLASEDLAAAMNALDHPDIAGEIVPAVPLTIGRAELRPSQGARMFVLAAAGRTCGLLVDGAAVVEYHVTDAQSRELAQRNAREVGAVEVHDAGEELTLSARLRGAAVWGWDMGVPGGSPKPAPSGEVPSWLRDLLDRKADSNPGRDMLASDRNGEAGFRWAVFHGAGDDLGLDVDPRASVRAEALYVYQKVGRSGGDYSGVLTWRRLVDQPIGRTWRDLPAVDLASTETRVVVRNDAGTHVTIQTRTRLSPLRDGVRLLSLSLQSESMTSDGRVHPLNITSLRVDGQQAPFVHAWGSLLVGLSRSCGRSDSLLLEVDTEGDVLAFPAGDTYWVLGTSSWYPRPSATGIEWADIELSLTAPSSLVPFVAGEPFDEPSAAKNTVTGRLKGPMGIGVAGAGRFHRVEDQREDARVIVATYGSAKREEAQRLAGIVHGVRGCLEELLGVPYPFRTLQLVEMHDWGWGQAPPGVIFITSEALTSQAGGALVPFADLGAAAWASQTVNERIAHEVAHGWFPHVAKISRAEDEWLSESLAEYMGTVCLERAAADQGRGRAMFRRQLSRWKGYESLVGDHASLLLADYLASSERSRRARYGLLYCRGPLVLHAIRAELARAAGGDAAADRLFFTWIRSYVKNFLYKRGGTPFFIAILGQLTARDWQPWFDRYVYGTESPPGAK